MFEGFTRLDIPIDLFLIIYIYRMEENETNFMEWVNNLTLSDVVNQISLILFTAFIIVLVVRAFRNKPSA